MQPTGAASFPRLRGTARTGVTVRTAEHLQPPYRRISPRFVTTAVQGAVIAACLLVTTACAKHITAQVTPLQLSASGDTTVVEKCANTIAAMPQSLGRASRVAVTPKSPLTAAWAIDSTFITMRCGRTAPHRPGESLLTVDSVDWRIRESTDSQPKSTTFIAVDRQASVWITIPQAAGSAADFLVDVGPTIASLTPRVN